MKTGILSIAIILIFSTRALSQSPDTLSASLEQLLKDQKFEEIIEIAGKYDPDDLGSLSLFYTGMALYYQQEDLAANYLFELSIAKNPYNPETYYYRGLTFLGQNKPDEALTHFRAAIRLNPGEADFHEAKAEILSKKGDHSGAIEFFQKALDANNTRDEVYLKLGDLYMQLGQVQEALDVYYACKYKADPAALVYNDCLFNIGLLEFQRQRLRESENALVTLINKEPGDYKAMELLMQVYFAGNKPAGIQRLRDRLYQAYYNGTIQDVLGGNFCFDQFETRGYLVRVYENFATPSAGSPEKHIFQVLDSSGVLLFTLQTEIHEKARAAGGTYLLTMTKGDKKSEFPAHLFGRSVNYSQLKDAVIRVIKSID